jgi:predicted glycogen debranching enzyme
MVRLHQEMSLRLDDALAREWLITNGIGGYASASLIGTPTRRYHGLLVSAGPWATSRHVMVNQCDELVTYRGRAYQIATTEYEDGTFAPGGYVHIAELRMEHGLPVTIYEIDNVLLEKRVWMPQGENTTYIRYQVLSAAADELGLVIRPLVSGRPFHSLPLTGTTLGHRVEAADDQLTVWSTATAPPLVLRLTGGQADDRADWYWNVQYRRERERDAEYLENLFAPGSLATTLKAGAVATLTITTEPGFDSIADARVLSDRWVTERERRASMAKHIQTPTDDGLGPQLALAADAFLVTLADDTSPLALLDARQVGLRRRRGIMAGYHWFSRAGRDALIALPGLLLATGRADEARLILLGLLADRWDGLLPARYHEDNGQPDFASADTSLWVFVALRAYAVQTGDPTLIAQVWSALEEIIEAYLSGTHFGIGVDHSDGLVRAASPHVQLTWMDAKLGDWVVTPRAGKPVEVNALWFNALRQMSEWATVVAPQRAMHYRQLAEHAEGTFTQRFWYFAGGYLYDVIDTEGGPDPSCRPNQVLAVALPFPVLEKARWRPVVDAVTDHLLTPFGLRTLSPADRHYVGWYAGNALHRDGAYHQGTVWPWLLGPFHDACQRVYPGERLLQPQLVALRRHLDQAGVGSISEIFDGDAPHSPQGSIADVAAVGEVFRVWQAIHERTEPERPVRR